MSNVHPVWAPGSAFPPSECRPSSHVYRTRLQIEMTACACAPHLNTIAFGFCRRKPRGHDPAVRHRSSRAAPASASACFPLRARGEWRQLLTLTALRLPARANRSSERFPGRTENLFVADFTPFVTPDLATNLRRHSSPPISGTDKRNSYKPSPNATPPPPPPPYVQGLPPPKKKKKKKKKRPHLPS